jgi:hypothetical protein
MPDHRVRGRALQALASQHRQERSRRRADGNGRACRLLQILTPPIPPSRHATAHRHLVRHTDLSTNFSP